MLALLQGGPNTVLRVIIEHMLYPIVLDVLYSIFQRYGKVLKIVTFTKNSKYYYFALFVLLPFTYCNVVSVQFPPFLFPKQHRI